MCSHMRPQAFCHDFLHSTNSATVTFSAFAKLFSTWSDGLIRSRVSSCVIYALLTPTRLANPR